MVKKSKNSPREKSEKELLSEIKSLLVVIASKLGAKSEEIGKAIGVKGSQIRKIRTGNHKTK